MSTSTRNKRHLIEEEVYDELPSPVMPDKSDCKIKYDNMKSNETFILRNWKKLCSICINCLLPTLGILAIPLG